MVPFTLNPFTMLGLFDITYLMLYPLLLNGSNTLHPYKILSVCGRLLLPLTRETAATGYVFVVSLRSCREYVLHNSLDIIPLLPTREYLIISYI